MKKKPKSTFEKEQQILVTAGTGLLCRRDELGRARTQGKQIHVGSMPPRRLYFTLPTPPLLSFAVSWDLFSPIFLPAGPVHFPAPVGLGWLARAMVDPSW